MTNGEFADAHVQKALEIMKQPPCTKTGKVLQRADELEAALRHMVCAWVLKEATFDEIKDLSKRQMSTIDRLRHWGVGP